jgi:mono/diheme cytochrome c family protein
MRVALALLCAVGFVVTTQAATAQEPDGHALYMANCRRCHGARGLPPKTMKTAFPRIQTLDTAFLGKVSDDSLVTVLTHGKSQDMPSFKEVLSKPEMLAVIKYVRTMASGAHPGSE